MDECYISSTLSRNCASVGDSAKATDWSEAGLETGGLGARNPGLALARIGFGFEITGARPATAGLTCASLVSLTILDSLRTACPMASACADNCWLADAPSSALAAVPCVT